MVLIIEFHPHQTLFAKIWLCCMHIFNSMSISTPVSYNLTTIWPLGATTNVLRLADVRKKIIWANISSSVRLSYSPIGNLRYKSGVESGQIPYLRMNEVHFKIAMSKSIVITISNPTHVTGQFIYKQKPEHLWYQHRIFCYRLHWCADIFIETI